MSGHWSDDPRRHDPEESWRYLVHGIGLSQLSGRIDRTACILRNPEFFINPPEGLFQRLAYSASLIDNNHRALNSPGGLILGVTSAHIVATGVIDIATGYFTSEKHTMQDVWRSRRDFRQFNDDPDGLLAACAKSSAEQHWEGNNEVRVAVTSSDGRSQPVVTGQLLVMDRQGRFHLPMASQFEENQRRLGVPIVYIPKVSTPDRVLGDNSSISVFLNDDVIHLPRRSEAVRPYSFMITYDSSGYPAQLWPHHVKLQQILTFVEQQTNDKGLIEEIRTCYWQAETSRRQLHLSAKDGPITTHRGYGDKEEKFALYSDGSYTVTNLDAANRREYWLGQESFTGARGWADLIDPPQKNRKAPIEDVGRVFRKAIRNTGRQNPELADLARGWLAQSVSKAQRDTSQSTATSKLLYVGTRDRMPL